MRKQLDSYVANRVPASEASCLADPLPTKLSSPPAMHLNPALCFALPLFLPWLTTPAQISTAQSQTFQHQTITSELVHLRSGSGIEWSDFPQQSLGSSFDWRFEVEAVSEATLLLEQIDVKQDWKVLLNDRELGKLLRDENSTQLNLPIPRDALNAGTNLLRIEAASETLDDIRVGNIRLYLHPSDELFSSASVALSARTANQRPMPCRFTILNENGALAALEIDDDPLLASRPGVVYSATGTAHIGLLPGTYTIYCGRGFEFSLGRRQMQLTVGQHLEYAFTLERQVDTRGWVACDTHIHTFEVSRHGDASLAERMVTLEGEGVELAIATDHNIYVDYAQTLERLQLSPSFTSAVGNEVTTRFGHFNVFPALPEGPLPNHRLENWKELDQSIHRNSTIDFVILNHPRDVHSGFRPFGTAHMLRASARRLDNRVLMANGMELINSAAMQTHWQELFHDWCTLLNRGQALQAIGSSDSHEVATKIVGQGRTYIAADDADTRRISIPEALESLNAGRCLVSLGLMTQLRVDSSAESGDIHSPKDDEMLVEIQVQGPDWCTADQVTLYANGEVLRTAEIPISDRGKSGVKAKLRWRIARPSHDIHLIAVATGPGIRELYWPIAKPYQPDSPQWTPYLFGCSGIVRIDADGDGKWTSALEYARAAIDKSEASLNKLVFELQNLDTPTAVFAADLWSMQGRTLDTEHDLPEHIQEGFARWERAYRETQVSQLENRP